MLKFYTVDIRRPLKDFEQGHGVTEFVGFAILMILLLTGSPLLPY